MTVQQFWPLLGLILAGSVIHAGEKKPERRAAAANLRADVEDEWRDFPDFEEAAGAAPGAPRQNGNDLMAYAQRFAHGLLLWIGFGTLVGLTAKAIMPGRDPGGPVATLLMGIAGSLIGCGVLLLFGTDYRVTPISPVGFMTGTAGAFVLLLFYRILSNSYFIESTDAAVFKHNSKTAA